MNKIAIFRITILIIFIGLLLYESNSPELQIEYTSDKQEMINGEEKNSDIANQINQLGFTGFIENQGQVEGKFF